MNEVAIRPDYEFPATIDDLSRFVLVGREKLVAVRAEIRAIDKVGLAKGVREQKLQEAQLISEAVLDAEVRIGQLMRDVPKTSGGDRRSEDFKKPSGGSFEKSKRQVIEESGFSKTQVQRFEELASHPEIVEQAKAEARENDDIVSRSLVLNMIRTQKEAEKRAERQSAITEQLSQPKTNSHIDIFTTDKKYRVIYADPPWSYNDRQDTVYHGGAVKHYPTMPLEEICALPVPAEKDSVLFLWTTSPILEDAFKVINAWGFKYKSSFIWDKVATAMGNYNSVRHEFLLICVRGRCVPDVPKRLDSVVSIERTEHSRKPDEFRQIIDTLYPVGSRLEMFAREAHEGWDVWGNMA